MKLRFPKRISAKSSPKSSNYYSGNKNFNLEDWESYYKSSSSKRGYRHTKNKNRLKNFYRIVVAAALFLVVLTIRETTNPLGVQARESLKYVLTTDWDFQPALNKAVQIGLQAVNMDLPIFNEMPLTTPAMVANTGSSYALPVSGRVTKHYGWVKDANGQELFNSGIFISCTPGAYVKAARSGRVSRIGEEGKLGTYILLDHGDEHYTLYAGLDEILVKENQQVYMETVIGTVGASMDDSAGLHFEIRENNKLVDPLTKLQPDNN